MDSRYWIWMRQGLVLLMVLMAALVLPAQTFAGPHGTQVETVMQGDAAAIWRLLMDFEAYPNWNPYIKTIEGLPQKGKRLHIVVKGKEKDYDFHAKVLEIKDNATFAWGGSALFFFKARHYFQIESLPNGGVKLIQGEAWGGLFGKSYGKKVYQEAAENFERMNQKVMELMAQ